MDGILFHCAAELRFMARYFHEAKLKAE